MTYADGTASFNGKMQVVSYHTAFKVFANEGATVTTNAEGIWVENAEWVNLIMAANTDYDATKAGCVSGASADDLAATSLALILWAKAEGAAAPEGIMAIGTDGKPAFAARTPSSILVTA